MNDPLTMQTVPLIEPLVEQIYPFGHIVYGLHRLEEVLLRGGQLGKLAVDQSQSHLSEPAIIIEVVCRISMH